MTKQISKFSLMAALVCGLSMGFVSCSDDDDNNGASEVINPDQTDEAIKAWSWVSVLTDEETQQDGWQNKNYTVTIGEQSSNNNNARLVFVENLEAARDHFAALVGCEPSELTGTKTFSAGELGKMEWTPSAANAANLAVVKVESKLFKQFEQLIYCTPDQAGDNASDITGNCYYRLGDVIEDCYGYYWVCVRPSFKENKAKDSYWVNVFNDNPETGKGVGNDMHIGITGNYIYSKYDKKYNNNTIKLPTCLKMDRQQNFNFANLIWAMINPEDYLSKKDHGLAGFDYSYHGRKYIRKVALSWSENEIFEKVFNRTYQQMRKMKHINFFYYGYHWKVGSTAGVWIYKTDGYQNTYSGSLDKDDTLFEMKKAGYGFDITRYTSNPHASKPTITDSNDKLLAPAVQFDEKTGTGYWVIRVATGKQLAKNYDPYKKLASDMYDTYRFNSINNFECGAQASVPTESDFGNDVVLPGEEAELEEE